MNNIQRVIEERNKEFDDKWKRIESTMTGHISGRKIWSVDTEDEDGGYVFVDESLKSHISETIRQVLQAVEEEVGNKGKKQNTNLCAKCNTILPSNWLPPICPDCFYCDDKDKWNGVRDKETKDAFTRGHDFAMSQVKSLLKCTKENIK